MPCSDTNNVIDLLPKQLRVYIDITVTSSRRHYAKLLSTTVGGSVVAFVIDLWHHFLELERGMELKNNFSLPVNYR